MLNVTQTLKSNRIAWWFLRYLTISAEIYIRKFHLLSTAEDSRMISPLKCAHVKFHHQQVREREGKELKQSEEVAMKENSKPKKVWLDINFYSHWRILILRLDILTSCWCNTLFSLVSLLCARVKLSEIASTCLLLIVVPKENLLHSRGKIGERERERSKRVRGEEMSQTHCRCCATRASEHRTRSLSEPDFRVRFSANIGLTWVLLNVVRHPRITEMSCVNCFCKVMQLQMHMC